MRYSDDVIQNARQHSHELTKDDMAAELNLLFGTEFTRSSIRAFYKNHKLPASARAVTYSELWPADVVKIVKENYYGKSYAELTELINTRTGRHYTILQTRAYLRNHKLNTGRTGRFEKGRVSERKGKTWNDYMPAESQARSRATCYKPGHVPENQMQVGTIVRNKDGYLLKKVSMTGDQRERWKFLHRLTWEEHNGPIPAGMQVSFKDGNKQNCSPDNLMLLSDREALMLLKKNLRSEHPEITQTGVTLVKLILKINDLQKGD